MIDYSLYLCTNDEMNQDYNIEECVEQAIQGGVTFVQLREKNKSKEELLIVGKRIKEITDKYRVPLVINDYIDVAVELDAAGVHLGQNDISCLEARKILGPNKIIGITVTNLTEARIAISQGATYLGVGAIYKSKTKKDAKVVGKSNLKKISEYSNIPIVVIGGINKNTIHKLKNIKIDGYAVIRAILGEKDIVEAAIDLKNIIQKNKKTGV